MADEKKNFPMLPVAHWWTLRKKFKQSIPGVVTDNYLATVLNMTVESARANVLPFLRPLGILDDEGRTTEQAKRWRDNGHYPDVCKAIVARVYPKDLIEAVPNPRDNRDSAKRWFANHTGAGDSACSRMAALYTVLIEADPAMQPDETNTKPKDKALKKKSVAKTSTSTQKASLERAVENPRSASPPPIVSNEGPDVSINLQIHISADASSDQIDQIFSAMAKHIYRRG